MKIKTNIHDIGWWFAAIILVFIVAALAGWQGGYYVVTVLSGIQVMYFTWHEWSLVTLPAQVRIVYFTFTLLGLWPPTHIPIYVFLFIGTFMVVFFDKCSIEFMLKRMPWNKNK